MQIQILTAILFIGLGLTVLTPFVSAESTIACEQDYVVVGGEWLSTIANKSFGDVTAYPAIFTATNLKSETDPSYATLLRVDSIPSGSKLCIPGKTEAQAIINPTAPAGLEVLALANAAYKTSVVESGSVTLNNGVFTTPASGSSATQILLTGPLAYGELNGAPTAAVVTTIPSSDESTYVYELHVFQLRDNKPTEVATLNIGAGTPVLVLSIANNEIITDVITRGPNDPLSGCCATQRNLNHYTLQDSTLNLVSTSVIGQTTSTASASATPQATPSVPGALPTATETLTNTATPTATTTDTATATPTPTNTLSPTAAPTNTVTPSATPTVPATPTIVPTIPATATPVPTLDPVSPGTPGLRVQDVTFDPFYLGNVISGTIVPATAYDNSEPPAPVGAPAHIAFSFDGEDRLWVIPAEAYQAEWDAAGNDSITHAISQLRSLLSDKPTNPKPPLPFLPQALATNDLAARVRYLDFNGGSGISYIGRWAQDPSPVLSSQTDYSFVGLTNDGNYIVSFRFPVHTSALPDEYTDLTAEHMAEIESDPQTYFQQTTDMLNHLSNGNFGPDLARLDALVLSLRVPPTGNALPLPTGVAATPVAGQPTTVLGQPTPVAGQPTSRPPTSSASAGNLTRLLAADWKWVETTNAGGTVKVPDPRKYTIRFNNAGGFGITADCNIGAGNYTATATTLNIKDIQSTLVFCGEDSLDAEFSSQLLNAATYSFQGTNLLIGLKADDGTIKFSR